MRGAPERCLNMIHCIPSWAAAGGRAGHWTLAARRNAPTEGILRGARSRARLRVLALETLPQALPTLIEAESAAKAPLPLYDILNLINIHLSRKSSIKHGLDRTKIPIDSTEHISVTSASLAVSSRSACYPDILRDIRQPTDSRITV